ncbi:SGNH/GDSL hydrolase family protein, partial [Verrucomicrobiota bacterium]
VRDSGAIPMVLTAPRAEVAMELAERGHGTTTEAIHERHDLYAGITREVSAAEGALLVDLAAMFDADPDGLSYFTADGIHLTRKGRAEVARRIHHALVAAFSGQAGLRQ